MRRNRKGKTTPKSHRLGSRMFKVRTPPELHTVEEALALIKKEGWVLREQISASGGRQMFNVVHPTDGKARTFTVRPVPEPAVQASGTPVAQQG
jgi:hypothetical protein